MPWLPGSRPGLFPGSVIAIKATGRRSPPVSNVFEVPTQSGISSAHYWCFLGCELVEPCAPRGVGEHVLDDVLTQRGLGGQLDRILAVEAGGAEARRRLLGGSDHGP